MVHVGQDNTLWEQVEHVYAVCWGVAGNLGQVLDAMKGGGVLR